MKILKILWSIWIFFMTWVLVPVGCISWWFYPMIIPRPYSYLMAFYLTAVAIFLMAAWIKEHR